MNFWRGKRVVLGIGGGIAAYKTLELIREWVTAGAQVRVVASRSAFEFVTRLSLEALSGGAVAGELFAPGEGWEMNHIRLSREADLVVIAPATADLLARAAQGRAEDLLSAMLLAARGPVLMAPAMNVAMWQHPGTQRNVAALKGSGVHFVGPVPGALACGEEGMGRLAPVSHILETARRILTPQRLAGRRILLTAGPTREAVDPVRYLSNRSSGRMGWAVALAALRMGAEVILVHGPVAGQEGPLGAHMVRVDSAEEMYDAAVAAWPRCHGAVLTAAVADYRPRVVPGEKIKKDPDGGGLTLELIANRDILQALVAGRQAHQVVVGFAAETGDLADKGGKKLARKGCDLLVGNDVSQVGSGFGSPTNRVTLFYQGGGMEPWPLLTKEEVAVRLLLWLAEALDGKGEVHGSVH